MHVRRNKIAKFPGRIITKVGRGKREICGEKEGGGAYRGVFEACCCRESSRWGSGALRLTVSYLKYIFVDGTFIDVAEDTSGGTRRDNIYSVTRKEASFPVTSPMKKPASQSQPPRSAPAYGLLTVCFMPLYTWLDVYRHRIPTDRFLLPFYSASKSSARFYETCDLIDRATSSSPPLSFLLLLQPSSSSCATSSFSSLVFASLSSIQNQESFFGSFFRSRTRNIRHVTPPLACQFADLGYDSITSC